MTANKLRESLLQYSFVGKPAQAICPDGSEGAKMLSFSRRSRAPCDTVLERSEYSFIAKPAHTISPMGGVNGQCSGYLFGSVQSMYRGTSPQRKRPPPYDSYVTLGIGLR